MAYFCDHCKIPGHSKERCFKLNGYPPGFTPGYKSTQQRKFNNYALTDTNEDSSSHTVKANSDVVNSSPAISIEQYNQLMNLLAQNNSTDQEYSYSGNALLAGTYCLLSSTNTNTWIIDSGVSDHMCSSLDFFHTFQEIH